MFKRVVKLIKSVYFSPTNVLILAAITGSEELYIMLANTSMNLMRNCSAQLSSVKTSELFKLGCCNIQTVMGFCQIENSVMKKIGQQTLHI